MTQDRPDDDENLAGSYQAATIEAKWQKHWLEHKTFKTTEDANRPKFYVLDMFPYPSGAGLHVGHPLGYIATDITARYKRMRGFNVLHPMGWDAFGLPAEQYAVRTGTHPRITTDQNINVFRQQIRSIGLSYDWDREIDTTSIDYYKWTQWIFLQLFKKGLAYESFAPVNWCPELGSVLANEEVVDGKSEIGGHPVEKKQMRQWVLKITEYAERLLIDLEGLDWPESIKMQQRNWIGKSIGADVTFAVDGHNASLQVFTTRPDTLFGATFMVIAPEHSLVAQITTPGQRNQVDTYVKNAMARSDRDRQADTEKTGVNTGAFAINPVNQNKIPIFIADYVLSGYGHGAIMAVPAHDERDHEFAKKFVLPISQVVTAPPEHDIQENAHIGNGTLINSDFLNGLEKNDAITKMCDWLVEKGLGKKTVTYKLRDWLFSRQRYWGEPIPVVHDKDGKPIALEEKDLPIRLPEMEDYKPAPSGESPLARAKDWLHVDYKGKPVTRETNTMPQWAGSCWYFLRFIDPTNKEAPWDKAKEKFWMPVDLYVGGAEHAVLHLLYARFWHKVLFDLGFVSTKEPFAKLVNQGMILGENGEKMSKSRGNVINPNEVVQKWGADSLRLYEMFMGPLTAAKPWQTTGIVGVNRFLKRVWRLIVDENTNQISSRIGEKTDAPDLHRALHKTIKKVGEDIESLNLNTGISAMMEYVNTIYKFETLNKTSAQTLVLLLAPFAPHICEELWQRLGGNQSLACAPWPTYDPALTVDNRMVISVQVGGKLRATIEVEKGISHAAVRDLALADPAVKRHLEGKTVVKDIYVEGKILNLVVK